MASMLVKAYKLQGLVQSPITNKFTDLEGHFGKEAANILVALEISAGTGKTIWSPDLYIPREQAAQMTYKADKLKKHNDNTSKPEETKKEMYMIVSSLHIINHHYHQELLTCSMIHKKL